MMYKVPTRFFRICSHCGDTKQVKQSAHAGMKSCVSCRHLDFDKKDMTEKRKATMKKNGTSIGRKKDGTSKPRKKKEVSNQAILRARRINAEHREKLAEMKVAEKPVEATRSHEELINEYLMTNKVTVLTREVIDYGREVNIQGY